MRLDHLSIGGKCQNCMSVVSEFPEVNNCEDKKNKVSNIAIYGVGCRMIIIIDAKRSFSNGKVDPKPNFNGLPMRELDFCSSQFMRCPCNY